MKHVILLFFGICGLALCLRAQHPHLEAVSTASTVQFMRGGSVHRGVEMMQERLVPNDQYAAVTSVYAGASLHLVPVRVEGPERMTLSSFLAIPLAKETMVPLFPASANWRGVGIGALIGLGVGIPLGLIAVNNTDGFIDPEGLAGVCVGGCVLLGAGIGALASAGASDQGRAYPGY